jgi:hypothetical protein
MKTLLTYAFVVSTLLPPGGFVCVEATGDVQIEYGHTGCDTSESHRPLEFAVSAGTSCDDCRDITIPASTIYAKRLFMAAPAPAVAPVNTTRDDDDAAAHSRPVIASISASSYLRHLSTTVIQR